MIGSGVVGVKGWGSRGSGSLGGGWGQGVMGV